MGREQRPGPGRRADEFPDPIEGAAEIVRIAPGGIVRAGTGLAADPDFLVVDPGDRLDGGLREVIAGVGFLDAPDAARARAGDAPRAARDVARQFAGLRDPVARGDGVGREVVGLRAATAAARRAVV